MRIVIIKEDSDSLADLLAAFRVINSNEIEDEAEKLSSRDWPMLATHFMDVNTRLFNYAVVKCCHDIEGAVSMVTQDPKGLKEKLMEIDGIGEATSDKYISLLTGLAKEVEFLFLQVGEHLRTEVKNG